MSVASRIIIVGASLAGLRAAEALRDEGFTGRVTIVGDERHRPYDRTPLSKQVALGMVAAERTTLAQARRIDAEWRLGIKATSVDIAARTVSLDSGDRETFDRLLIATGTRARRWHAAAEAALEGVVTLRTREDAAVLRSALTSRPRRVVVIGGGFTGCEIASACCELKLAVTLVEASATPLASALGLIIGRAAAALQIRNGVDLRCGTSVDRIEGDAAGHVRCVHLSAKAGELEADLVVVALGSVPNLEWLDGSGLAVGHHGVACDAGCRVFDQYGITTDDIFACGDISRFPHPLFNFEFMTLEHWGNAVSQARVAAHNMLVHQGARRPHIDIPAFWSSQFDVSIKSLGVPPAGDEVMFVQGSVAAGRFVALYGRERRVVAAVSFDHGKWLPQYGALIEAGASFPRALRLEAPRNSEPVPAEFPHPSAAGLDAYITLSGHSPYDLAPTLHRSTPPSNNAGAELVSHS